MFDANALMELLALPEAFENTGEAFWDDEHISQQMLAAHLDPAFAGASRSPEFMDCSAAFIAKTMPPTTYGRLFDFGCGPGLYTSRLATKGYAVTGLDISRSSIAFAKKQAVQNNLSIEYFVQDYLTFDKVDVCDIAIMIYCDYGVLCEDVRAALLRRVYTALRSGGRFFLDVFTPQKLAAFAEVQRWQSFPKGGFWSSAPHFALFDNRRYPARVSLEHVLVLEGGTARRFALWTQYFTLEMLAAEVEAAGFNVVAFYDDATGAPYTGKAETLAVLLEKPS